MRHDFGYFAREGFVNMFSHGFMSFAAMGITVACLLIMGTFTLVAVNADANLKELEASNEIVAFVDENYTAAEEGVIKRQLQSIPSVTSVTYTTRQQAMQQFAEKYPDESLFQDLDPNILRDRFTLKIADLQQISAIKRQAENIEGIAKVNAYEEVASGFITIRNIATVVSLTLIAVLFIVSVFIISNTIKLTTFDRREEIAIMRMVGATNGFIRWPFVYEGLLMGFLGAMAAFLLQWGLYEAVAKGVDSNDTLQLISIVPFESLWLPVLVVFGVSGILIGVGGSLAAIRKFLQV